jgi:polar amino acid transport system substrate-binding protein
MENKTLSYIALGLAVIAIFIGSMSLSHRSQQPTDSSDFQKVMASGTLRVGYVAYPPYIIKDPNTGQLSGIFYDLTNQLASQLALKVEWVEGAGYGTIFTDLDSNRYDVYGGGIWANSTRSKVGYFTIAAFYNSVNAYARTNDHRFDNNLAAINDPSVKISAMDGELGDVIAKADYPKAQEVSLPQSSPFDQLPLQVITNKADVAFLQPDAVAGFLKANPNTLREVSVQPLRLYGNTYAVKLGDTELQNMLDVALQEAINNGTVAKIVAKYQSVNNAYLLPATPYAH